MSRLFFNSTAWRRCAPTCINEALPLLTHWLSLKRYSKPSVMLFKPALNYFYLFFDRSYSEKTVFFSLDYKSKGTDGAPFSPLEPSRRRSAKAKKMALILQSLTESLLFSLGTPWQETWKGLPPVSPNFSRFRSVKSRHRGRHWKQSFTESS